LIGELITKAPFFNDASPKPLVVVPSAKITKLFGFLNYFYCSTRFIKISKISYQFSLELLSKNKH